MSAAEHPAPSHAEAVAAHLERLRQVAVNVQAIVGAAIDESAVASLGDPAVMHVVEALRQVERAAYRARCIATRQQGNGLHDAREIVASCPDCTTAFVLAAWVALSRVGTPKVEPGTASEPAKLVEVRRCSVCSGDVPRVVDGSPRIVATGAATGAE